MPKLTIHQAIDAKSHDGLGPSEKLMFKDGQMTYVKTARFEIACRMNFQDFPFDNQTCPVEVNFACFVGILKLKLLCQSFVVWKQWIWTIGYRAQKSWVRSSIRRKATGLYNQSWQHLQKWHWKWKHWNDLLPTTIFHPLLGEILPTMRWIGYTDFGIFLCTSKDGTRKRRNVSNFIPCLK